VAGVLYGFHFAEQVLNVHFWDRTGRRQCSEQLIRQLLLMCKRKNKGNSCTWLTKPEWIKIDRSANSPRKRATSVDISRRIQE